MSNIDKHALREAAEKATPGNWWINSHGQAMVSFIDNDVLEVFATDNKRAAVRHDDTCNLSRWRNDNDATFIATADPATVLALLDELEAADALNKHLELAIRRAEGCSEALRRKLEAAEERIAELSELPMKSDVEKKPQNTLSGRPVYLGDGSDAKETLVAGKRDIHRYESSITDRAWKGD
ncbi:ead/Ea22-like family protein [Enterobacter hormaechei]